jgi:hypothetical protein
MKDYNCCHSCFLKWAESRKEDWKTGWRPSEKEVKAHVKLNQRIILR